MAHPRTKRATAALPSGDLIWAKLEAALGPVISSERPAGSVTVDEVARHRGICTSRASAVLRQMVAAGDLRAVPFRGSSGKTTYAYVAVEK